MAVITREIAEKIAYKLKATFVSKKRHDIAQIYHEGKLVALFGIRRGSKKDEGHDFIPSQIFVTTAQAKLLGQCPLLREDWIQILREKGKL
jgi:hypothetical protein